MKYKSEFKVSLLELDRTNNKEELLQYLKMQAAKDIGLKVCQHIPFRLNEEKSERRKGQDLNNYPPVSIIDSNNDHYGTEFIAVSIADWREFKRLLDMRLTEGGEKISRYELGILIKDIESK